MTSFNVLKIGATRKGKTLSAVADLVKAKREAALLGDPHMQSLAQGALTHATGNILYEKLSEIKRTLPFSLLTPSTNSDLESRRMENHRKAEAFVAILLRRRDSDGMAGAPLMEEWVLAAIQLFLFPGETETAADLAIRVHAGHR